MEYATKLLVIVSLASAIALETVVMARSWPELVPLTLGAFVLAAAISLAFDEVSVAVVLFFAYLMPALIVAVHGKLLLYYGSIWSAAFLGAMFPRSVRSAWAFPGRWKGPLVLWAISIALTWPVVALRELDFTPALLNITHLASSMVGGPPPLAAAWICDVAVTLGLGILWFDWLFLAFTHDEQRFRRRILAALAGSWAIATAAGIYQLFGDMLFLNRGLFGSLGRASGTMVDANPFGVIAAAWGPPLVAAAWLTPNRTLRVLALCGLLASWLGLWASAARTAFGTGCIAFGFLVYATWSTRLRHVSRRTRTVVAGAAAVAAVGVTLAVVLLPATTGPLPRLRNTAPVFSAPSVVAFFTEMWNRNGYGMVATHLIREFPFFGVGLGAFHLVVPDYHFLLTRTIIPPDNAQNWYRHQLVENGLVGSIGWMLWVAAFAWFVLSARVPGSAKFSAILVKGTLVALGVISLVGMPTQNIAVAVTLWTFAFWYWLLAGPAGTAGNAPEPARLGLVTWAAIWTIVAVSVGGTAYGARDGLRVPQRAVTAAWPYFYGFSDMEPTLDLARHSTVWAKRRAVAVLAPSARWVKLTISLDALNIAKGPVDVKVWCDTALILSTRISTVQPITRYVAVRDGHTRMLVETWVSGSVRPADYGLNDKRELGLRVEWDFVDAPPAGEGGL
jgi:hypothetical protein